MKPNIACCLLTFSKTDYYLLYLQYTSSGARAMRGFGAVCLLRRSRCVFLAPQCAALRCPWISSPCSARGACPFLCPWSTLCFCLLSKFDTKHFAETATNVGGHHLQPWFVLSVSRPSSGGGGSSMRGVHLNAGLNLIFIATE